MMFKEPTGYDPLSFYVEGLSHSSLMHYGKTPLCLVHLRKGGDSVRADVGEWRLWEDPQDVPRAAEVAAKNEQETKYLSRVQSDINSALASRNEPEDSAEDLDAKVNRELTPGRTSTARQRSKSNRSLRLSLIHI